MIRKYIKRVITWGLLSFLLIVGTIYGRTLVLGPLDQTITDLGQEQSILRNNIVILQTQINRYTELQFDNEEIKRYIPTGYSQLELEQNYILRPVRVAHVNGTLKDNYRISRNVKPANLRLSDQIQGVLINATIDFTSEDQIYRYLEELHDSIRAIYIESIQYELPGEGVNPETFVYTVHIEYYVFHYDE